MAQKRKSTAKKEDGFTDEVFELIKKATQSDVIAQIVCAINNAVNERSLQQAKSLAAKDIGYFQTYDVLRTEGNICRKDPSEHNMKILALAVFGWMPTELQIDKQLQINGKFDLKRVRDAIDYMIEVPATTDVTGKGNPIDCKSAIQHFADLSLLLRASRGTSYVGVSKFLHFLLPESFAIFDRKIEKNLSGLCNAIKIGPKMMVFPQNIPVKKARQAECFILYELAMRETANRIKKSLRAVEQVLFYYDKIDKVDAPRLKAHE